MFMGCATPIEVKEASQAQLELIQALDGAVVDLQQSLASFHREKEARIREVGRVNIAQQAIDVATAGYDDLATWQQLLDEYQLRIHPWMEYAFERGRATEEVAGLQKQVARLNRRLESATDTQERGELRAEKVRLTNRLDDRRELVARLENVPPEIKQLEQDILSDVAREQKAAEHAARQLGHLRTQIALMRVMQQKVDRWLASDMTLSTRQLQQLSEAYVLARQAQTAAHAP